MDETNNTIQSLYDQSGLLDILLGVEEYFDNMDLYAYKNWIYGELIEGPIVSKYWVEVVFKFSEETFPDPVATKMFEKQGTKVSIKRDYEDFPIAHPRQETDMQMFIGGMGSGTVKKPKSERKPVLLYKFQIPRRLVNPESFDEYKLMASDFNQSDMNEEIDDPVAPPDDGAEMGEEQIDEISQGENDMDELGGPLPQ